MTENEFMQKVLSVFPEAMVGTDNDGQLIIYTNLEHRGDGTIGVMDDPNFTGV